MSKDGERYYCPSCEKSFAVQDQRVTFSEDLVESLADQVSKRVIEKLTDAKKKPVTDKSENPKTKSETKKRHKWEK